MRRRLLLVCSCLALAAAQRAPGPTPVPDRVPEHSVRPLEQPSNQPPPHNPARPDESPSTATTTPKGALKLLAVALRDGDPDRIRQVMYATNPSEARMITAMAEMAKAMAGLQKSAVKAFGKEGAKEFVGDTDATDAESKARIDSSDVKIQGDTATVTMEDGEEAPVVLKRIDGRWRMPMSELSRGADATSLEERLAGLAEQTKLVRDLAEEVAAGKYANPAQAHEAWQSRAMQSSMRRPPIPRADAKPRDAARQKVTGQR